MSNSAAGITSLPFAPGNYPFALTEDDPAKTLSGDQWAWRFLRLSPAYRYDHALWAARPAWLEKRSYQSLAALKAVLSVEDWQTMLDADARYFTLDGRPLGHAVEWPHMQPATLGQMLPSLAGREADIVVRELDSARLYGVGHWFNPDFLDLPQLPRADSVRSWFYALLEPLWESPEHALLPNPDSWIELPEGRVNVGMEPDIGVRLRKDSMTHYESQNVRAEDGSVMTKIVKVARPAARYGFDFQTELALLVCLDGNVPAQMKVATSLLQSAQAELQPGAAHAPGLPTYEPIIVTGAHPRAEKFSKLHTDLRDLTASAPQGRRNWCLLIFDVRFDIQSQVESAATSLKERQLALSKAGMLVNPVRHRAGTKSEKLFWLKAALCCLETQLALSARYPKESFGRKNLTEAILSPSHLRHAEVRGTSPAATKPSETTLEADTIRDAVETGKALAMGQYAYLIGAIAEELLPTAEVALETTAAITKPAKVRRFMNGKEFQGAPKKRNTTSAK
ncbi:MAG: hypothetical protein JSR23_07535 [Proteobacteria bacterium]|nr:hypothetical protein [Pseudomonadota bacterium]